MNQLKIKIYLANPHPDNLTPVYMALYPFKEKIVYVNRNEKFDIMIDNRDLDRMQLVEVVNQVKEKLDGKRF